MRVDDILLQGFENLDGKPTPVEWHTIAPESRARAVCRCMVPQTAALASTITAGVERNALDIAFRPAQNAGLSLRFEKLGDPFVSLAQAWFFFAPISQQRRSSRILRLSKWLRASAKVGPWR